MITTSREAAGVVYESRQELSRAPRRKYEGQGGFLRSGRDSNPCTLFCRQIANHSRTGSRRIYFTPFSLKKQSPTPCLRLRPWPYSTDRLRVLELFCSECQLNGNEDSPGREVGGVFLRGCATPTSSERRLIRQYGNWRFSPCSR